MTEAQAQAMAAIERHFHALIRERCGELVDQAGLTLPSLAGLTTSDEQPAWFPVPGMAGGFAYRFASKREPPVLIVESWSRIVVGSEQRHEITAEGCRCVEEG
jgi:hypothetical protein